MKIGDIARLAGVSTTTVSRVLNNSKNVKEETRIKVNNVIKEQNYYPNMIARNLSSNKNDTIGLIVPDIKNTYFSKIVNNMVTNAGKKNLNVVLGCSNEDFEIQKKYIELFIKQRVKGIIIAVTKNSYNELEFFENISSKIPVVFIERKINSNFPTVCFENINSTIKSIEKLIEKGHKKIAFLAGDLSISTARERLEAYKRVLKKYNIKYDEKLVFYGDFSMESGYILAKEIFKTNVSAIYISNNLMLLGFLKALKEYKKNEDEYLISTFEHDEIVYFINQDINSYKIPFSELTKKSMDLLEEVSNKENKKNLVEIELD
ncbi:LacI family DNA-binding transcriptional regulator [Oceanivirga miroungae]|uniref:Sugar-binding transcriptional regulator, LacI family n=1 Tax=Oceanivirga miroungae TaxID=1130046 RepID=A0A6I8M6G5_9FUSO|nr:LacI family DNA-binding transcriptional regulator [Oceanivirga miroungae]VWL85035.1 sugar-binding transcriptional regulator, LacI family [Oceanivirga miroungae]